MNSIKYALLLCAFVAPCNAHSVARVVNNSKESVEIRYKYRDELDQHVVPLIAEKEFVEIDNLESLSFFSIRSIDAHNIGSDNLVAYIKKGNQRTGNNGIQLTITKPESASTIQSCLTAHYAMLLPKVEKAAIKRKASFWFDAFPWIAKEIACGEEIKPWQIFKATSDFDSDKDTELAYKEVRAYWEPRVANIEAKQSVQAKKVLALLDAAYTSLKTKDDTLFKQLQEDMTDDVAPEVF